MDRIDAMRVFVRIVERQSFSRAAEDLGLPASTATDAVKALERRLGVRLLDRTTRQVRPTLDGEAFQRRCVAILAEIDEAESAFGGGIPRGVLRISLLGSTARAVIVPALPGFLERFPELDVYLNEADRFVDLVREGIDGVIRGGHLEASDLVGRQLASLPEVTVAAPDYLARHGTPAAWDALEGQLMVGFHSSARGAVLPLCFEVAGRVHQVVLPARLVVEGAETLRTAALNGLGIVQLPRHAIAAEIAAGRLVEILSDTPPRPMPVHLLWPRERQLSLRLRVFVDWVVELYRGLGAG
jgi:DNA-binding transcriptional LysR family regulator